MRGFHRWPVNSPHKGPVTRKMFPFDDVIIGSSRGGRLSFNSVLNHCDCQLSSVARVLLRGRVAVRYVSIYSTKRIQPSTYDILVIIVYNLANHDTPHLPLPLIFRNNVVKHSRTRVIELWHYTRVGYIVKTFWIYRWSRIDGGLIHNKSSNFDISLQAFNGYDGSLTKSS